MMSSMRGWTLRKEKRSLLSGKAEGLRWKGYAAG